MHLPIAQPPWTQNGKQLESLCRKALYEFKMLENMDSLGIALSGGKDSLTLLYLLHAINGRGFTKVKLHAFHVEGAFSCGAGVDASFLNAICKKLDIAFTSISIDQNKDSLNCYSCSRKRRSLIFDEAKKNHITSIAFGHHRDDLIQTLLLNLFHKAEFAANLAKIDMLDYGVTILRPLVYIPETLIFSFARQFGYLRSFCQCPIGQDSMRKKVNSLISEIEKYFPHVRSNLALAAKEYGSNKAQKL